MLERIALTLKLQNLVERLLSRDPCHKVSRQRDYVAAFGEIPSTVHTRLSVVSCKHVLA